MWDNCLVISKLITVEWKKEWMNNNPKIAGAIINTDGLIPSDFSATFFFYPGFEVIVISALYNTTQPIGHWEETEESTPGIRAQHLNPMKGTESAIRVSWRQNCIWSKLEPYKNLLLESLGKTMRRGQKLRNYNFRCIVRWDFLLSVEASPSAIWGPQLMIIRSCQE